MNTSEEWIRSRPDGMAVVANRIAEGELLAGVLDELDYGVMLLTAGGALIHANDAARALLARGDLFCLREGRPMPADANQCRRWRALLDACAGNRRALELFVTSRETLSVAVVSVGQAHQSCGSPTVLATFGRQRTCEPISLNAFARASRLSATETKVLASLAASRSPSEIASEHSVSISTIRTQIKQVLAKTGSRSIRDLLGQMSRLAPMRAKTFRPGLDEYGCGHL